MMTFERPKYPEAVIQTHSKSLEPDYWLLCAPKHSVE
jgi:hypothetical protein